MNHPTHKQLIDTECAIGRDGAPHRPITSVSLDDYTAACRVAAYYKEQLETALTLNVRYESARFERNKRNAGVDG